MMKNMRLLDFKGKSILDCGSGTGILAILAEQMGASSCIALDNDTWCYENCKENIALNASKVVTPVLGVIDQYKGERFDGILANIHRNFLVEYMEALAMCLNVGGYLLVSGFYSEDAKRILDKALEYNLIATYRTTSNNWDAIVLQKISA
jgi:ribosomal protein L11 methyltransferase